MSARVDGSEGRRCAAHPRAGRSLVELVLVFWLFGLVLTAVGRFAARQHALAEAQQERVRWAEAVRTAALVLGSELRVLSSEDIVTATDSLRLRAMRGSGAVCGIGDGNILVRYRGIRLPDPSKDSLLLLDGSGGERPHRLVEVVERPDCGGSLSLRLDPVPELAHGFAIVYETGAYHLADAALRYRLGNSGRQPLTEEVFRDPRFQFGERPPRALLPAGPTLGRVEGRGAMLLLHRLNELP